MKRLVLLSEWKDDISSKLEQRIKDLIGKDRPQLGYIPSQTDPDGTYYFPMKNRLDRLGISDYVYCDIDEAFETRVLGNLGNCDAIFLSGGNTFHFLARLRERGMLNWLRGYVNRGGVVIGVSAGAMIMTDKINVAEYVDTKYLASSQLSSSQYGALGLVDFYFYPHWTEEPSQQRATKELKRSDNTTIFACPDGGAIVIDGDKREYFDHVIEY
ncbi:Type 1 glutamine amidotransferase-like domain-containing protein [Thalassobacillus devorans]|uniref:Type 1 glutamine amidotransferase-like domain-containing protein n=1 Tax=Thalassobacillus devorans TaxID=279813 RepID=UPI000A1CE7C5|nr:Type 1 glutamine amidotransferase-like domain-containing protein [Thalassobacillus devorans]